MKQLPTFGGLADDSHGVLAFVEVGELRPQHRVDTSRGSRGGHGSGFFGGINANNHKSTEHPFYQHGIARLGNVGFGSGSGWIRVCHAV